MIQKIVKLGGSVLICQFAGIVGSLVTLPNISTWYAGLIKPSFTPPNWVFGPVWIFLYFLMGLSLYLFWQSKKSPAKSSGWEYFLAQLVLNSIWSVIFFGLTSPSGGLVIIIALWCFIIVTIYYFRKVNRLASYLLYPYLAWVSFASLLNLGIVILNKY